MSRPWHIWVAFGLCLAVVLAAMGWLSLALLRLEGEQAQSRRLALLEENVRLSLWRMDSALGGIIARENARPYFSYSAFYPAERAYNKMFAELKSGEVLMVSPLLTQSPPFVLLHFQFAPDGKLSSPQVPEGNMLDLAEGRYTTQEQIEKFARRFGELRTLVSPDLIAAALPAQEPQPTSAARSSAVPQRPMGSPERGIQIVRNTQIVRNAQEWQARSRNFAIQGPQRQDPVIKPVLPGANVGEGVMTPLWVGDVLLLARRVSVGTKGYIQGCWLDWPTLKEWLLSSVRDLLPDADIVPVRFESPHTQGRMLTALPVRLLPGVVAALPPGAASPLRLTLIIAWVCVLLGAGAVALLLSGTVRLSERRGAFVSAVTHELRTPLTTFRMYTEMLAEKMVPPDKREHYLKKLCAEADRLGHLVENVLAYARLERGSARSRVQVSTVGELVDRLKDRLSERARQAGLSLAVDAEVGTLSMKVRADAGAVEQILFNLIDNACKYAARATGGTATFEKALAGLSLEVHPRGGFVLLKVRDHGPGISKSDRRLLFKPFRKSAKDAAHSAPGVGLGLALSRRLARQMGARLYLDDTCTDGACFILKLPLG